MIIVWLVAFSKIKFGYDVHLEPASWADTRALKSTSTQRMWCDALLNHFKQGQVSMPHWDLGKCHWPCPSWTTNRERGVVSGTSRSKLAQVVPTRIGAWVDLLDTQDKACSMSPMGSAIWITIRGMWTPAHPCHLQDKVMVLGPAHWAWLPSHFEVILKKWLMHNLVLSLPKSNENWSLTQSGKPLLGENKTVEIEISFLDGIEKNIEPSLHD